MDHLNDDCLYLILSNLPFQDKVRLQLVNTKWRHILGRLIGLQKSLGNAVSRSACRCSDSTHWISDKDIVPKRLLTNLSVLPLILKKCPELRALAITDLAEMNFEETEFKERRKTKRVCSLPTAFAFSSRLDCHSMGMRKRKIFMMVPPPTPRPANAEAFLSVVAKYASKLECINVSGLRLNNLCAFDTHGGMWLNFGAQCGQNLKHLRVYSMNDSEMKYLLSVAPNLSDIGVSTGLRGTFLSQVPKNFERCSIYCLRLPGLQELVNAGPNVENLKSLSLNNVTKDVIQLLSSKFLNLEKLSLRLQVKSVDSRALEHIRHLRKLKRLALKRRESSRTITQFDGPLLSIMIHCNALQTIILSNLCITDQSLKAIPNYCPQLKDLRISYKGSINQDSLISYVGMAGLSRAESLEFLKIDYPNYMNEDAIIHFLLNARKIRKLFVCQCRELILALDLFQAAIKVALSRRKSTLELVISTPEKISIPNSRILSNIFPGNLSISITTGEDSFIHKRNAGIDTNGESEDDIGKVIFDWEDDQNIE